MALNDSFTHSIPSREAPESDYGSDLDNDAWDAVFSQPESQPTCLPRITIENIEEPVLPDDAEPQTHSLRLARIRENLEQAIRGLDDVANELQGSRVKRERSIEIEYDERNRRSFSGESI